MVIFIIWPYFLVLASQSLPGAKDFSSVTAISCTQAQVPGLDDESHSMPVYISELTTDKGK